MYNGTVTVKFRGEGRLQKIRRISEESLLRSRSPMVPQLQGVSNNEHLAFLPSTLFPAASTPGPDDLHMRFHN